MGISPIDLNAAIVKSGEMDLDAGKPALFKLPFLSQLNFKTAMLEISNISQSCYEVKIFIRYVYIKITIGRRLSSAGGI